MIVTLGSIGRTYGGLTGKTGGDFGHGAGRFITFVEVMGDPRLRGRQLERVEVKVRERQNQVLQGDVLFNGSSETPEEVALGAVVDFEVPAGTYLNSFCFGFRIDRPGIVDPTFLAYYFRSRQGRELVYGLAQGSTRYNISKTKLLQAELDLPEYDQQVEIVKVLLAADLAIDELSDRLAKARAVKQGILQTLMNRESPRIESAANG